MNTKYYRWVICLAGTLTLFCTGGLLITGFSVYTPYLISEGGLTNAQVSVVLMMRNLFTLLTMFLVVPYIRRLDIRAGISLAIFLDALSLLLFSVAETFLVYCIAMGLSGVSYGFGGMVSVSVIIKRWFSEHEGLALGICTSGTGLSAVIGSPIITKLIETRSMKESFRIEALFIAIVALLVFVLLKNYPSREKKEEVQRIRAEKRGGHGPKKVFRLSLMMKGLLILGILCGGASFNSSPFLSVLFREKGFDAIEVSYLISLMGIALCIGKCIYGYAADRLGKVCSGNLFYTSYVLAIFACAVCAPGNRLLAYLSVLLLGFGFPMLSVGLSELASETAYEEYYADAVKIFQIVYMIGSLLFGPVPGFLADVAGNYTISYYILAILALLGACMQQGVLSVKMQEKRKENKNGNF